MTEKVNVEFEIINKAKFLAELQTWTDFENSTIGYRADDQVEKREALRAFTDAMEIKLRRNEQKKNWEERPLDALLKLLLLEVEKLNTYYEYSKGDAVQSLVDLANWSMFLWDRLKRE